MGIIGEKGLGLRVHMSSTFQRWFVGKRGEGVGGGSVDVSVNILESETAHGPSLMIDRLMDRKK